MVFSLQCFRHHETSGSSFRKGTAIMRPSTSFAQTIAQGLRQTVRLAHRCDRHRAGYLALAAIHAAIGSIQAAGAAMPEAVLTGLAAIIYTALAYAPNHRA
jgi:hypothetical protein